VLSQYSRLIKVIKESQDAYYYSYVSNIEGRPAEELEIEKIDYVSKADAVY